MAAIRIGMINWNRHDFVERSMAAVLQSTYHMQKSKVSLWDNGSTDAALPAIYDRMESYGVEVIRNKENIGLDAAQNKLLEHFFSDEETQYVFLLEDGCLVMPWAIPSMNLTLDFAYVMNEMPWKPIGIVGCSLSAGPPCQRPGERPSEQWIQTMLSTPDEGSAWNNDCLASWSIDKKAIWETIEAPDPFLWGITRKTWETVGKLDEAFWQGWGTLNDYCYRARCEGIHSAVSWYGYAITWDRHVPRPWAEENPEFRQSWESRGAARMGQKWGGPGGNPDKGWDTCKSNFVPYSSEMKYDIR